MKKRNCSRALITGGAGFIGSHIVDELIERGIETHVIDNMTTGSINNLSKHRENNLLHIHNGDISNIDNILGNSTTKVLM